MADQPHIDQVAEELAQLAVDDAPAIAVDDAPAIVLTDEQNEFVRLAVEERRNLLLLAPAGYGKSMVIQTLAERFQQSIQPVRNQPVYTICASTGLAASLIGGRTLHSTLGIGIGRGSPHEWFYNVRAIVRDELRILQVIVIDEVSMMSAELLDNVSEYLQLIRGSEDPFGGVQVILVGDLCQLPPVNGRFVFSADSYVDGGFVTFRLTQNFRQTDQEFANLLNEIRLGEISEQTMDILLNRTAIEPDYSNGMTPMRLFSRNDEVDQFNDEAFDSFVNANNAKVTTYRVSNRLSRWNDRLRNDANIPMRVDVAVGCQVVVTRNLGMAIVNGTQGIVEAATPTQIQLRLKNNNIATIRFVPFMDPDRPRERRVLFNYMPIRLGYASTIHKAQGMTLQLLEVDFRNVFAHGQAYTALSRVTDLRGIVVRNLTEELVICAPEVREFYEGLDQ